MKKDIIVIENMFKEYGQGETKFEALKNINITINEGDFIGIMGPSGSGKSTLLNIVATLDLPTKGKVLINGKNVKSMGEYELSSFRRETIGFIFQNFNLLDTLTIRDNILSPLIIQGVDMKTCDERVETVAKRMDITDILDKFPEECSGGQKQRAAVCRALVTNPKMIVADEPTGALDSKNSNELLNILKDLNENEGITILMVTHDSLIASYSKKVLLIKDGVIDSVLERGVQNQFDFYNNILKEALKESKVLFMEEESVG